MIYDWNPEKSSDSSVNRYISNISEKIAQQEWPNHLSNDLNNGYANNLNVTTYQTGFHNSDSSTKMGQDVAYTLDSNKPQYVGGVLQDGLLNSVVHSSSQNFYRQQAFRQGIGEKRSANNMSFPIYVNNVQPWVIRSGTGQQAHQIPLQSNGYKIQRINTWTPVQARPRVAEESLSDDCYGFSMESRKQKHSFNSARNEASADSGTLMDMISVQSKGFKIQRIDSWKPVQSRPLVAEEILSHNCFGLTCNLCGPATFCTESRKRKYPYETSTNESGSDSGTLMDVLNGFLKSSVGDQVSQEFSSAMSRLPPLEQYSDKSEDDSVPKLSFEENTSNRKGESSKVRSEVIICNTFTDLLTSVNTSVEAEDLEFNEMPNLEQSEDVTMDLNPKGNNLLKGPEGNNDNISVELKEPSKLSFEEKTSQVSPKVICAFNTTADDYESVLEPMQLTIPTSVMKSDNSESQTKYFDDKSGNIKCPSASLADSLTASQIKQHLSSFIQPNKEITPSMSQNMCQLCSMDKLPLAPPPMYCSSCDLRIREKVGYYRLKDENTTTQHSICKKCFAGARVCIKLIHGGSVSKTNLKLTKNDEEREDSWVQCDRCQLWQHRICGLYNDETDTEGKAEYVCPKCCLKELENGTGIPLPKTVLGAKDLPRTNLSDHIEQRLFRRLKEEREETAKFHGIELEKVPEAEGLVVRVALSDDKELEVKQQFRDIFRGENYPEKMPFRSKLILLFQRTEGVDLCLFGMYVQEFGSDCDGPSKRCVYISYLDSVKYFQPERKTTGTESLRTFVYHEILIGYLEYCKKRGFATCYLYSCPLKKGDDYIFYCHPTTQKTPEKKKLRQWYKSMLRKATNEGIVVGETNLYNQFFVPSKEGNMKISASRLPYFDGDTWSEAAIETSKELEKEEKSEKLCSKLPTKRMLMSMGQDNPSKDALVMERLGRKILCEKENLMVVRLQHICTYCHELILSGSRWSCNQCNKIHLCSRCYDDGKLLSQNKMHTCRSGKTCLLSEDVLSEVPLDTNNKDDVLVNNFFKTRDDFLNKCRKSQYHFDKLGHAKYSSMMILYRLTHPWT